MPPVGSPNGFQVPKQQEPAKWIRPCPQVQDLIECFPDEDQHLQKFCQWRPKGMRVEELVTLMERPPSPRRAMETESGRESESESESERRSGRCITWMDTLSDRARVRVSAQE